MNRSFTPIMTSLRELTQRHADLLRFGETVLGAPVRGLTLSFEAKSRLMRGLKSSQAVGLDALPPVRLFAEGREGHSLQYGMNDCRFVVGAREFRILQFCNHVDHNQDYAFDEFWIVAASDYLALYRGLRRLLKRPLSALPPLMPPADLDRLWKNTIGFLQRGEEALDRFGVTLKRGVLLMGSPGNGKTTACRWLESQAERFGYEWRTVSSDTYQNMCNHGNASRLFDLDRPGVVLFDDLDHALRNRDDAVTSLEQARFLSELDGVRLRQGVVYLFTTNAGIDDLDPAFRRPGRIDHMIRFSPPNADLRREFIASYWPREISCELPIPQAVRDTDGLSFAELDEIKKQLVMNFLDSGRWDWDEAFGMFRIRMEEEQPKRPIGFCAPRN